MRGTLELVGWDPDRSDRSVLWLCSDPAPGDELREHIARTVPLEMRRLDQTSLADAIAMDVSIVVDLASSMGPIAPYLSVVQPLEMDLICILSTSQVKEAAGFINAEHAWRLFIAPVGQEDLLSAIGASKPLMGFLQDVEGGAVRSSIHAVGDLLALAMPEAFGKGQRIARYACILAAEVGFAPTWTLVAASILSQVGMVTLSPEVATKLYRGRPLSDDERVAAAFIPIIAEEITQGIAALEPVRRLIRSAFGNESELPTNALDTQLLRLALTFEDARAADVLSWNSVEARLNECQCLPSLRGAMRRLAEQEQASRIVEIPLGDVEDGMILAEDVYDRSMLLLASGQRIKGRVTFRLRALGLRRGETRRVRVIPAV